MESIFASSVLLFHFGFLQQMLLHRQKKVLPKILTRLIVNQHFSVGERGMIDFDLAN